MMGNISAFQRYKLHNIPEALRMVANQIEHGDLDAVRCVLVVETRDERVIYRAFGEEPFTRGHAIGMCFQACKDIGP